MDETTGVLRPVVVAYLDGGDLSVEQLGVMRAYLRQWIALAFVGEDVDRLRASIDQVTTRKALELWLAEAVDAGVDPL